MEVSKPFIIREVNDKKTRKEFLDFPARLYKKDKNWSRPLNEDIEKVFDPKQNKKFRQGNAIRYLLQNAEGRVIGKIAAFYDDGSAKNEQPTGGIGFFDCINNQEGANLLFDRSKEWLQLHGMEAMDGPVNFGERDSFWGCLVEGYTEPLYNMPYNFPYYKDLFLNYGFGLYFNQYTYHMKFIRSELQDVVAEKGMRVLNNPDYSFEMIRMDQAEKYALDFMEIFNKAWARFPGVPKMRKIQAMALMKEIKPIADPRLIYFGYHKGQPVAFFIMMPDISQIFKKFNGNFNLFNKIRFLYLLKVRKKVNRVMGRIFGVVPQFHGKGVESGLIMAFARHAFNPNFPYSDLEMNWIGDFNPIMMKTVEQIGGKINKIHQTYRYMFDRNKPVKRMGKVNQ